jgi:hypothetical protein
VKTPTQKPARWSKWDSFRDGRPALNSAREMSKLYRDIDAGWRYFVARRIKKGVLEQ